MRQLSFLIVLAVLCSASQCPSAPPAAISTPAPTRPTPTPSASAPFAPTVCTEDTDCGVIGTGAMCLNSKCLTWELDRKGEAAVDSWGAAANYCASKRTATEHWRLPTKQEEKYLCRVNENYPDRVAVGGCPHAQQVLGADFENRFFWSSTCWDSSAQPSRESSNDNPCSVAAWGVNFDSGYAPYDYVVYNYPRVRCVRGQ